MFFSIEGPDYCGKSTIIKEMRKKFPQAKYVREPGFLNNPFCREMREIIQHSNHNLQYETEALLYVADRNEMMNKFIYPNMKDNIIISDREYLSTLAYQSIRGKQDVNDLIKLHIITYKPPKQHMFYIDIPLHELLKRSNRDLNKDNIENSTDLKQIYNAYLKIISEKKYHNQMNCTIEIINPNKFKCKSDMIDYMINRIKELYNNEPKCR